MSKRQLLIILGLLTMGFLFLGFPAQWDKFFALVLGLIIVITSYGIRPSPRTRSNEVPYVEHRASPQNNFQRPETSLDSVRPVSASSDSITGPIPPSTS